MENPYLPIVTFQLGENCFSVVGCCLDLITESSGGLDTPSDVGVEALEKGLSVLIAGGISSLDPLDTVVSRPLC